MNDTLLTNMERPGLTVVSNPSPQDRDRIALQFRALKAAKHAVICDEVHHGDDSIELRVHHYRSCTRCLVESGDAGK